MHNCWDAAKQRNLPSCRSCFVLDYLPHWRLQNSMNCSSECYCLHSTGRNWDCMHKTITTFSILSLAHHTSRAMELVNNDFSHKYVASSVRSERNGSITRKNQWLKLLSSLSTHFLQCFQLFLCTVRRAAIYNPWTVTSVALSATLQIGVYGLVAYPLCTVLSMCVLSITAFTQAQKSGLLTLARVGLYKLPCERAQNRAEPCWTVPSRAAYTGSLHIHCEY